MKKLREKKCHLPRTEYLEENLPADRGHPMIKELVERSGKSADSDPILVSIGRSDSAIRELAQ